MVCLVIFFSCNVADLFFWQEGKGKEAGMQKRAINSFQFQWNNDSEIPFAAHDAARAPASAHPRTRAHTHAHTNTHTVTVDHETAGEMGILFFFFFLLAALAGWHKYKLVQCLWKGAFWQRTGKVIETSICESCKSTVRRGHPGC